ncbi:MAG: hypothetical protein KAS32_04890 [Candidatus Peribacteraceae bacterium]|nr:hypothetical protein [Candidatus Peribacteraceae bacterium]
MGEKKGKKVTVRESAKEKPNWSDAGVLMKKGANEKEQAEQQMIIALSIAFDIPPQGITILADNPYINKQGLEFVFHKWRGNYGWSHFLAKPIEIAKKTGETAVFKTTLYNKEGKPIANGYGTANAGNVKLDMVKTFLNEMAETRSQNRCLRKVCSPVLYKTFIRNVKRLKEDQRLIVAEAASNFGSVTAEEVGGASNGETPAETLLSEQEMKDIANFLQEINNAKTQGDLKKVGTRIKMGVKSTKFNENQVTVLKEAWTGKAKKLTFK